MLFSVVHRKGPSLFCVFSVVFQGLREVGSPLGGACACWGVSQVVMGCCQAEAAGTVALMQLPRDPQRKVSLGAVV